VSETDSCIVDFDDDEDGLESMDEKLFVWGVICEIVCCCFGREGETGSFDTLIP